MDCTEKHSFRACVYAIVQERVTNRTRFAMEPLNYLLSEFWGGGPVQAGGYNRVNTDDDTPVRANAAFFGKQNFLKEE